MRTPRSSASSRPPPRQLPTWPDPHPSSTPARAPAHSHHPHPHHHPPPSHHYPQHSPPRTDKYLSARDAAISAYLATTNKPTLAPAESHALAHALATFASFYDIPVPRSTLPPPPPTPHQPRSSAPPVPTPSSPTPTPTAHHTPDADPDPLVARRVQSLLNKLTPEKFGPLSAQVARLLELPRREVVTRVFDKARAEPHFAAVYAELCGALAERSVDFRGAVVARANAVVGVARGVGHSPGTREAAKGSGARGRKEKVLGGVVFAGELLKKGLIEDSVVFASVEELIKDVENEEDGKEEAVETLCTLLTACGRELEDQRPAKVDTYFGHIAMWATDRALSSRLRFMVLDLLELREHQWVPRRAVDEPKTLDEVHFEVDAAHDFGHTVDHHRGLPDFSSERHQNQKPPGPPYRQFESKSTPVKDSTSQAGRTTKHQSPLEQKKHPPSAGKHSEVKSVRTATKRQPPPHKDGSAHAEDGGLRRIISIIDAVIDVQDRKELERLVKDNRLGRGDNGSQIILAILHLAMEKPSKDRTKVCRSAGRFAEMGLVLQADVFAGATKFFSELLDEENSHNTPLAPEIAGESLALIILGGAGSMNTLASALPKAPESRRLRVLQSFLSTYSKNVGPRKLEEELQDFHIDLKSALDSVYTIKTEESVYSTYGLFQRAKSKEEVPESQTEPVNQERREVVDAEVTNSSECPKAVLRRDFASLLDGSGGDQEPVLVWIARYLAKSQNDDSDHKDLVSAVCEEILDRCARAANSSAQSLGEELQSHSRVLMEAVRDNSSDGVLCLFAAQRICANLGFQNGFAHAMFEKLYDFDVIGEESYEAWREDMSDDVPGKTQALFEVNDFVMWLAESDDDEDEDA